MKRQLSDEGRRILGEAMYPQAAEETKEETKEGTPTDDPRSDGEDGWECPVCLEDDCSPDDVFRFGCRDGTCMGVLTLFRRGGYRMSTPPHAHVHAGQGIAAASAAPSTCCAARWTKAARPAASDIHTVGTYSAPSKPNASCGKLLPIAAAEAATAATARPGWRWGNCRPRSCCVSPLHAPPLIVCCCIAPVPSVHVALGAGATVNPQARVEAQELQHFLRRTADVVACPAAGCDNWVAVRTPGTAERCDCSGCGHVFCSACQEAWHFHCSCQEAAQLANLWRQWVGGGRTLYLREEAVRQSMKATLDVADAARQDDDFLRRTARLVPSRVRMTDLRARRPPVVRGGQQCFDATHLPRTQPHSPTRSKPSTRGEPIAGTARTATGWYLKSTGAMTWSVGATGTAATRRTVAAGSSTGPMPGRTQGRWKLALCASRRRS